MQVAARYGSTSVPQSMLTLASGQPATTGTGALQWIEVFNEVNGYWDKGRNTFFTPFEYAAMLSAAYDGHAGVLGPGYGARTADPNIKVAMSGLAYLTYPTGVTLDYVKAINLWSQAYRVSTKQALRVLTSNRTRAVCCSRTGTFRLKPSTSMCENRSVTGVLALTTVIEGAPVHLSLQLLSKCCWLCCNFARGLRYLWNRRGILLVARHKSTRP